MSAASGCVHRSTRRRPTSTEPHLLFLAGWEVRLRKGRCKPGSAQRPLAAAENRKGKMARGEGGGTGDAARGVKGAELGAAGGS